MNAPLAQLAASLVATATPWIVVRIALAVASRHGLAHGVSISPGRSVVSLGRATAAAALAVGALALFPAPSAWIALAGLLAFAGLSAVAVRVLHDLDLATRAARYVDESTRTASLVARRYSDFLPVPWRMLQFGAAIAGLALFTWRLTIPSAIERRLFQPVAFVLIASVFLWLYEAWIHALVTGPMVPDSADSNRTRRRTIRMIFATETVLVIGFLALAHGLLDLDWTAGNAGMAFMSVTGALLGVIGCALALSSDLITRRYRAVQ